MRNKSLCRKWVIKAGIQRSERKNSRTLRALFGPPKQKPRAWTDADRIAAKFRAAFYRASLRVLDWPWDSQETKKERAREYSRDYCARRRDYYRENSKRRYHTKKTDPLWVQGRREEHKRWRIENPEKWKAAQRRWLDRNRQRRPEYTRRQRHKPSAKLASNLRRRLRDFVKKGWRQTSSIELIGCGPEKLRNHFEKQFKGKMSWDNYGTHWVIDHILPCASFDLARPDEQRRCFHWTNLRPLTRRANQKKRDKIIKPQQSLLLAL